MVRVDEDTRRKLDAWVASGAVRLGDAIQAVEEAKERLRNKARDVFGDQDSQS